MVLEARPDALEGLWEIWRASTSPALAVRGEHSPYLTSELMDRMVTARPHAEGVTIAGAGHNAHTDQPEAFHTAIRDWLGTGAAERLSPIR